MQSRIRKIQYLQVRGAAAYAASGTARVELSELQPINSMPGGVTYLEELILVNDALITSAAVGGTLGALKQQDLLEQVELVWPGHRNIVALRAGGGAALYQHQRLTRGRTPKGAALVIAGGGTGTVRNRHRIRFSEETSKGRHDKSMPISMLRHASLQTTWANGAAGAWLDADHTVTSGALTVVAVLTERPEFRVPSLFSIETQILSGLDEQIPVDGRVLNWLAEIPPQAAATIASTSLTAANRVLVSLTVDGQQVVDRMSAADMVELWNESICRAYAERITDHALGTTEMIPYHFPSVLPSAGTYAPLCKQKPRLLLTGTAPTPTVLYEAGSMLTLDQIMAEARAAGHLPAGCNAATAPAYLDLITSEQGGVPWPAGLGATRLPVRVRRTAR